MKYIYLLILTLWGMSHGYCLPVQYHQDKLYVQPNQITLSEEGIFVYLENAWHAAESVHADEQGIYITTLQDKTWNWKCPKCGHNNSWLVNKCEKCGKR